MCFKYYYFQELVVRKLPLDRVGFLSDHEYQVLVGIAVFILCPSNFYIVPLICCIFPQVIYSWTSKVFGVWPSVSPIRLTQRIMRYVTHLIDQTCRIVHRGTGFVANLIFNGFTSFWLERGVRSRSVDLLNMGNFNRRHQSISKNLVSLIFLIQLILECHHFSDELPKYRHLWFRWFGHYCLGEGHWLLFDQNYRLYVVGVVSVTHLHSSPSPRRRWHSVIYYSNRSSNHLHSAWKVLTSVSHLLLYRIWRPGYWIILCNFQILLPTPWEFMLSVEGLPKSAYVRISFTPEVLFHVFGLFATVVVWFFTFPPSSLPAAVISPWWVIFIICCSVYGKKMWTFLSSSSPPSV